MRNVIILTAVVILIVFITVNPMDFNFLRLTDAVSELDAYREKASTRCSGGSYKKTLGTTGTSGVTASKKLSKKLLDKGYGTGSLEIGVTLSEKTQLAVLLGNLSKEQVQTFLSSYEGCMKTEMVDFYKVKKLDYPEIPKTTSVIWADKVYTEKNVKVANMTERSGNWRSYEVCVSIPENAFMDKQSVKTTVVGGVGAGSWGDWRNDIQYVDSNEFGPTKVCRGFDHQIHDQDRLLEIAVNYKLPSGS